MPGIDALLRAGLFEHVVATQDWHPAGHVSFASSHTGSKPFDQIALYGQPSDAVARPLRARHERRGAARRRGTGRRSMPSSAKAAVPAWIRTAGFRENHGPNGERPSTGLAGWLSERGVVEVYVCGLARDVCVLWTAQDAVESGFRTHVLWDLTRPVTPATDKATRDALAAQRIDITAVGALAFA